MMKYVGNSPMKEGIVQSCVKQSIANKKIVCWMRKVLAKKNWRKTLCDMRNTLLSSDVLLFISAQLLMRAHFSRIFGLIHLKQCNQINQKSVANSKVKKKLATNVKVSAKGKQYKKPFQNKSSRETMQVVLLLSIELLQLLNVII